MKSEVEKETEKANDKEKRDSDRSAGFAEDTPIRPLHDCACYFISLAHTWLERVTHLPFPIGPIIGWAEDLVDRWTHPLAQALQCHSLSILASIDDQVFCLVEGCGLCSKVQLQVGLSQLYTQGLVGASAGLWIKYELAVKDDIRKAVTLAGRVPVINLVTPVVLFLVAPSARAVSNWLLKQGERRSDESTRTEDGRLAFHLKQDVAIKGQCAVVTKSLQLAGPVRRSDVCDVQYEGQNVSYVRNGERFSEERRLRVDDVVKDDVLRAKEDVNVGCAEETCVRVDDVVKNDAMKDSSVDVVVKDGELHAKEATIVDKVLFKEINVSADNIVEDEVFHGAVDKAVPASERIVLSQGTEKGEDFLPDVLEMLESSWLLGTSAFPKNAPTFSQKKHTSSSGSHSRRNG
ncbi:hypothetical protein GOP47_0029507 [Adiantum capillus-veneris]|nr:hypothetical protein GOP47_0029507 [Adiantum capillus-veneris]